METLLTVGDRDVDLLNAGDGTLILREPYFDLDEPVELRELFEGQLGTADGPICGVMVLPPAVGGEPPPRVPLSRLEFEKWWFGCRCYQGSR